MAILIDTNIFIALADENNSLLSPAMIDALTANADHMVSVASLWEIAIKNRLGKLSLPVPLSRLTEIIDQIGFKLISIEHMHVLAEINPWPPTRDPFDRLLLAQCAVEGLRLMTLDRVLSQHPLAWRAS
jgi:PIN domain nuclease of toxin-antitoxin system